MNERFKFRAWDKTENAYIEDAQFTYDDGCEGGVGSFRHYSFRDLLEDKSCIVEQCTGLKDKNGKLIYESDLVTRSLKIYRVDWCEEKLGFVLRSESNPDDTLESLDITIKTWDIIGNVHENEELLDD